MKIVEFSSFYKMFRQYKTWLLCGPCYFWGLISGGFISGVFFPGFFFRFSYDDAHLTVDNE